MTRLASCLPLLSLLLIGAVAAAADSAPSAEGLALFEKKIRPVLVAQCYQCHSAQAAQVKGGLLLDTRAGVRRGGESGEIVTPGEPAKSLLIQALKYSIDAPAMPPRKQLSAEVIADFEQWIKLGVPDPRDGKSVIVKSHEIDIEKGRRFWAFVPPRNGEPPAVKNSSWPLTTEDRFLLAAMESKGLKPVGDADPNALVRRLYFDLVGLPPSVQEVDDFVTRFKSSGSREEAYSALVDKLLASPQFGERWGRHWLDVARFAETSGRQINFNYPHAWRYRDWVIAALNADKPFDRFVREQVAGDLLPADNSRQRAEQQIATGFLALGPKPHSERDPLQFQMDLVDEQIDATTLAFLGLTVACARCQDHKFDPIPQRDYYALAGIFRSTETCYGTVRIIQSLNPSPLVDLPFEQGFPSALESLTLDGLADLKKQLATLQKKFEEAAKGGPPTSGADFNNLGTLTSRVSTYMENGRAKLLAMGVRERTAPTDSPLFGRGEIDKPGEIVPRGLVQVVSANSPAISSPGSGRRELAEWLAARDNPLTARVFANRVWTHLFGRGLVSTPDNFGAAGTPPDHPQLLDHLAVAFMDDGWSVKRLIRRLVTSRAYRQSTRHDAANFEIDPDNVCVWRMSPARLEAEVIRDTLLELAGQLDKTPPVGSPVALDGENGSTRLLRQLVQLDVKNFHRAVYLPVIRDNVLESLALFDFADPSLITSQRAATTVPAQSLYLLNSPFVLAATDAAAARLLAESTDRAGRLRQAYLSFLGREPSDSERAQCEAFLAGYAEKSQGDVPRAVSLKATPPRPVRSTEKTRELAAWSALCQALICTADFLYRP